MLNFIYTWLGLSNGSGPIYLFWSGFFGDVTIFASVFYTLYQIKKRSECHESTCHKHGKYEFNDKEAGVVYKLCAEHHPGVPNEVTHAHLIRRHSSNYER